MEEPVLEKGVDLYICSYADRCDYNIKIEAGMSTNHCCNFGIPHARQSYEGVCNKHCGYKNIMVMQICCYHSEKVAKPTPKSATSKYAGLTINSLNRAMREIRNIREGEDLDMVFRNTTEETYVTYPMDRPNRPLVQDNHNLDLVPPYED